MQIEWYCLAVHKNTCEWHYSKTSRCKSPFLSSSFLFLSFFLSFSYKTLVKNSLSTEPLNKLQNDVTFAVVLTLTVANWQEWQLWLAAKFSTLHHYEMTKRSKVQICPLRRNNGFLLRFSVEWFLNSVDVLFTTHCGIHICTHAVKPYVTERASVVDQVNLCAGRVQNETHLWES